jgi:hypothetical protein
MLSRHGVWAQVVVMHDLKNTMQLTKLSSMPMVEHKDPVLSTDVPDAHPPVE